MTISQIEFTREAHRRARENQPKLRRRVNSGISSLFGSGFIATAVMAGLDLAPWWVMGIVAAVLAVGEVLSQMFSKGPLTPSQEAVIAEEVAAMEAEANPEPTAEEVRLGEVQDDVRDLARRLDRLIESRELEAQAATVAAAPDPDEELRRAYDEV